MVDIEKLKALAEAARTDNAMYGDPNDWQPSFGLSPAEQAFAEAVSPAAVLELIATLQDYKRGAEVEAKLGDEARAERDQLRAEVEALRKGAERYRWLMSELGGSVSQIVMGTPTFTDEDVSDEIDKMVRATMAGKGGKA